MDGMDGMGWDGMGWDGMIREQEAPKVLGDEGFKCRDYELLFPSFSRGQRRGMDRKGEERDRMDKMGAAKRGSEG